MKERVGQTVKSLKFHLKEEEIGTREMSGKSLDKLFVNRVISADFEILRAIADKGNLEGNHEFKIFKLLNMILSLERLISRPGHITNYRVQFYAKLFHAK